LGRKPLIGTVAANMNTHGTGALNIDASRIETEGERRMCGTTASSGQTSIVLGAREETSTTAGRWPANVIHDGSEEVLRYFPEADGQQRPIDDSAPSSKTANVYGERGRRPGGFGNIGAEKGDPRPNGLLYGDAGSAARFFYCAKADADDRLSSKHPTVKPVDLMAYLVKLVTPPGGLVLDPFAGSGTTGMACMREGFQCILIEREAEYVEDIHRRLAHVSGADTPLFMGGM
jgi:site-specific DNA-methyltransferase (adenine-specific)